MKAELDDILTRRGIAKIAREQIVGSIDSDLAERMIGAPASQIDMLIKEHYERQKATAPETDE